MQKYERMQTAEFVAPFAEAWGVTPEILSRYGACFAPSRGRNAKIPVWNVPMRLPSGEIVGIKSRALVECWESGGKKRRSNNRGKVGLVGYPTSQDEGDTRPLLIVEGEKDFIVGAAELSEWYVVVGNLGGASTFKEDWAKQIVEDFSERGIYFLYDNDDNEAGFTGALKAARKCWRKDSNVHVAHLPIVGTDVFDFLRGKEEVCEAATGADLHELIRTTDPIGDLSPHEARQTIQAHLDDEDLRRDDVAMARALFAQLQDHGGRFYHDGTQAFLLWQKEVYTLQRDDSAWALLQMTLTGLSVHAPVGSRVCRSMRDLGIVRGARMSASAWQCRRPGALYLPLYNTAAELVRITPDHIDVVPNGTDDVVLLPDPDIEPIAWLPDEEYDETRAKNLWDNAFGQLNLTPEWQHFVSAFGLSFPFYSWTSTHPHLRFQGPAGSGKSTGFIFLSAIVTGNAVPVGGLTHAGMWRLAARSPMVVLDDLEAGQVRREPHLKEFFLRAAMGGQRVMAGENVSETVRQTVGCHLLSNGISPIDANTPALTERIIAIPMLPKEHHSTGFYAQGIVEDLLANRNQLWNFLFRHCQRTLRHLENGAIKVLLPQLPPEKRQRLHEFFALLSVSLGHCDKPAPFVDAWLEDTSEAEILAKAAGSSLVTMMMQLPAYLEAPDDRMAPGAKAFQGIDTSTDGNLWTVVETTHTLHAMFLRMRRELGIPYSPGSAQELGNELSALAKVGEQNGIYMKPVRKRRSGGGQQRCWSLSIELDEAAPIGKPKPPVTEDPTT
jgi:hypothetical protein